MAPNRVVALAGGVGAARFLAGLVRVVPPERVTAIVNTGDDRDFHGLRVCPDLDTITYTLAGRVNPDTGWGLRDDTFECLAALSALGRDTWFALGDRDLATHVHRSERLRAGASLAGVTAEMARASGVAIELLPMSEDPAPTWIERTDGTRTDFQEYLVRDGAPADVARVDLSPAAAARPGPGVLEALDAADAVLICPSNPVVSIGPILAMPAVGERLRARRDAVAVSPIIGGRPVKGPADRLMAAQGFEVSAHGVASMYREVAGGVVIDRVDADLAPAIERLGLRVRVAETLMRSAEIAGALAASALELCRALR